MSRLLAMILVAGALAGCVGTTSDGFEVPPLRIGDEAAYEAFLFTDGVFPAQVSIVGVEEWLWASGEWRDCIKVRIHAEGGVPKHICLAPGTHEMVHGASAGTHDEHDSFGRYGFFHFGFTPMFALAGTRWAPDEVRELHFYGVSFRAALLEASGSQATLGLTYTWYEWPSDRPVVWSYEFDYHRGESLPRVMRSTVDCDFLDPPTRGCGFGTDLLLGQDFQRGTAAIPEYEPMDWRPIMGLARPSPTGLPSGGTCPSQWLTWQEALDYAADEDPDVAAFEMHDFVEINSRHGTTGLLGNQATASIEAMLADQDGKTLRFLVTREETLLGEVEWRYERKEAEELPQPPFQPLPPTMLSYCDGLTKVLELRPNATSITFENVDIRDPPRAGVQPSPPRSLVPGSSWGTDNPDYVVADSWQYGVRFSLLTGTLVAVHADIARR